MIIQCEQCKTRFKVGDDKLQAGGIRVRCSKCNHVFLAQADAQQPTAPLGSPQGVTGLFASVNASVPPSPSSGGGFGSAQNRSGIFRAPTMSGMPAVSTPPAPSADPFASLGARSQPPAPSADPFANLGPRSQPPAPSADPFANLGPKGAPSQPPAPSADPFSGLAARGTPSPSANPFSSLGEAPRAPGPVTAMSMPAFSLSSLPPAPPPAPPPPPPASPFSPSFASPPPDPFAPANSEVLTSPGILPRAGTPSRPTESMSAGELAAARSADPFGAQSTKRDAFQAGQAPVADPFASVASAPPAAVTDPFGGLSSSAPPAPAENPFAPPTGGDPFAGLSTGTSSAPPPPPSDEAGEADPFAGIEADVESRALFDMPTQPPAPSASAPPAPAPTDAPKPALSTTPTHAPATGADMKRLKRLEMAQRTREIVWGVAQVAILFALVTVAVVVGRGGSFPALLRGDVVAALGGAPSSGALVVTDVRVARRAHKSGAGLVVVTGTVWNKGLDTVPGARVDVRFDAGAAPASGWAWSDVDGLEVEDVSEAPDALALSARAPKSSALAPGERAPFVVVGPAPAEGARAQIEVVAVKPPPPPASSAIDGAAAPEGADAAQPAGTKPATTTPAGTKPAGTKPAATTPAGTKPAAAKPAAPSAAPGVAPKAVPSAAPGAKPGLKPAGAPTALKPKAPAKP